MESKRLAEYYARHHTEGARYSYLYGGEGRARIFQQWIGRGKRVLDLGCRDGTLTEFLIERNWVIGADIDIKALQICKERLKLQMIWLDLNERLPFKSSSSDVVVAGELIEHLFYPELFLEEVIRVLRLDGQFVGSTPNGFRLRNRWKFLLGGDYEMDRTHLHHFSFTRMRKLLERFFVSVTVLPYGGHMLGGGRFGIPVGRRTPRRLGELFALDILWNAKGIKGR